MIPTWVSVVFRVFQLYMIGAIQSLFMAINFLPPGRPTSPPLRIVTRPLSNFHPGKEYAPLPGVPGSRPSHCVLHLTSLSKMIHRISSVIPFPLPRALMAVFPLPCHSGISTFCICVFCRLSLGFLGPALFLFSQSLPKRFHFIPTSIHFTTPVLSSTGLAPTLFAYLVVLRFKAFFDSLRLAPPNSGAVPPSHTRPPDILPLFSDCTSHPARRPPWSIYAVLH